MAVVEPEHVLPVFLMGKQLPLAEDKEYSVFEICTAAEKVTGFGNVVGAQRIGALWRLYPKTTNARLNLLTKGVVLRGLSVQPRDKNPFIVTDGPNGEEREIPSVRLTIGNIPLSVSNDEILKTIEQLPGVKTRSRLMDERARDSQGKLSHFKTGRRFVYINTPTAPLPKITTIGHFQASLFHPGQKTATCSKCLEKGHHVTACVAEVRCRQCLGYGHTQGDPQCQLAQEAPHQDSDSEQEAPKKTTPTMKQSSLAGMVVRGRDRHRSATPTSKRGRSLSVERSPRTAGAKKLDRSEKGKESAGLAAVSTEKEKRNNSNIGGTDHDPPPP